MTNKIGLAGDWHGSFQWTRHALHTFGVDGVKTIFHAGDFSLGWPGLWPDLINICEKICKLYDMKLYITPGNHENWEWINTREFDENGLHQMTAHTFIMQRGARMPLYFEKEDGTKDVRSLLSLGGAPSIDFDMRTPRVNWWPEEMILQSHVDEAVAGGHADIMICHDAPDGSTPAVQRIIDTPWHESIFSRKGLSYAWEGRQMMNMVYQGIKPTVFAHGHFHAADVDQDEDTLWISLGCNNQVNNIGTLDLETLQFEWTGILKELPV